MRKKIRLSQEQKLMNVWWIRIILAIAFLAIGYWFASIAINDGNLFHYAIAIVLVFWAFIHLVRGIKVAFAH